MKTILLLPVVLATALSLPLTPFAPAALSDEEATSKVVVLTGETSEKLDLAELADGASRSFGSGEEQVTITRRGDHLEISTPESDEAMTVTPRCSDGEDDCVLIQRGEGSGHAVISIASFGCLDDDQEEPCSRLETKILARSHGKGLIKLLRLDEEDGETAFDINVDVDLQELTDLLQELDTEHSGTDDPDLVSVMVVDGGGSSVFTLSDSNKLRLVCPEGDASLLVDKDEAEQNFLCPRHQLVMVKTRTHRRVIRHIKKAHRQGSSEAH